LDIHDTDTCPYLRVLGDPKFQNDLEWRIFVQFERGKALVHSYEILLPPGPAAATVLTSFDRRLPAIGTQWLPVSLLSKHLRP
jgi:hypothetical protein